MITVKLRDETAEDESFLRQVYECSRAQELAMMPWTAEQRAAFLGFQFDAQASHYRSQFPDASFQIILASEESVGRLYVERRQDEIRVLDIVVLTDFRNRGIGTTLIRDLLREADEANKCVTVWVEKFNPSQATFQKLGFVKIQEDGFSDLMEYRPARNR